MKKTLQRKLCTGALVCSEGEIPAKVTAADLGPWLVRVEEFTEHLKVEGYAARTVWNYSHDAKRFAAWLLRDGRCAPTEIRPEDCLAYQRALYYHPSPRGGMTAISTQASTLAAVRSFTGFLKSRGLCLIDPGLALRLPRRAKRLPRDILSEEEVTTLLTLPDTRTVEGYRDRTVIEVLYGTGIRSGELQGLDTDDVDLATGRLRIREGKGGKDRVVPMGELAAEFVSGYLKSIRPKLLRGRTESALFLGMKGGRLHKQVVKKILNRYVKKAGIVKHIRPHSMRHTCATHMLRHGASIRHVQEQLGHGSIATTEQYTRVEIGDLAEVHAKCHPRERM